MLFWLPPENYPEISRSYQSYLNFKSHFITRSTTKPHCLSPVYSSFFNSAVNSVPHHKGHGQFGRGFSAPDTWWGSIKRLGWPHRRWWTVKEQAQNSAGTHMSCLQLLKRVRPACGWSKGTGKHFTPWVTMKHTSLCLNPRAKTKQAHICMVNAQESNWLCQSRVQCWG